MRENELGERNRRILEGFYKEHLPDGHPSGRVPLHGSSQCFGIDASYAGMFANVLWPRIFAQYPTITPQDFSTMMQDRLQSLHKLSLKLDRTTAKELRHPSYFYTVNVVCRYIGNSNAANLSFPQQLRSLQLHQRLLTILMKKEAIPEGAFTRHLVGGISAVHPENPLAAEWRNKEGGLVATLGGYFYYRGNKKVFRLTNVQGTKSSIGFDAHLKQYEALSGQLGENWRVGLVQRAIGLAREKGLAIEAEEPKQFDYVTDSMHKRQVRQYRQTYRKAGLMAREDKVWVLPERENT